MYRLLIVDDEPVIVEGLYHLFQQIDDIELDICMACSGDEALEWMSRTQIDIVLSDIQMPGFDGMQLMEEICKRWPACRVVMFTGYSDFEYVYRSIQHEGVKYLLKSEGDEVLLETVRSLIDEIKNKVKADEWMELVEHQLANELPLLQKEFMLNLLHDPAVAETSLGVQLQRLGIHLFSDLLVIPIIGRMDWTEDMMTMQEQTRRLYAMKQVIERCANERFHIFLFSMKNGLLYALLQPIVLLESNGQASNHSLAMDQTMLFVRELLVTSQRICTDTLDFNVSFIHTSSAVEWCELGRVFRYLNASMDYRIGRETGVILMESLYEDSNKKEASIEKLNLLEAYLLAQEHAAYLTVIKELLGGEQEYSLPNHYSYAEVYYSIAIYMTNMLHRLRLTDRVCSFVDINVLFRLEAHSSYGEMIDYFSQLGETVVHLLENEQANNLEKPIRFLQTYISAHLDGDLSLVKLADLVHFNPSYLSRMFKRVCGENLSDYINGQKISKAIELIQNPNTKIQEAAAAVGFDSVSYFNRVFKSITGMTPKKHREQFSSK